MRLQIILEQEDFPKAGALWVAYLPTLGFAGHGLSIADALRNLAERIPDDLGEPEPAGGNRDE